jgi:hypothetical protein
MSSPQVFGLSYFMRGITPLLKHNEHLLRTGMVHNQACAGRTAARLPVPGAVIHKFC